MTSLDSLRDWHARRKYLADIPGLSQQCRDGWDAAYFRRLDDSELHPFPATLDAADASFPPNINWYRGEKIWSQGRFVPQWWAFTTKGKPIGPILATDSKIRDLYELSKLALEQEAA